MAQMAASYPADPGSNLADSGSIFDSLLSKTHIKGFVPNNSIQIVESYPFVE